MAQPPDTHPVTLDSGAILYVPDRYGEEETERLRNEYNATDKANADNVVPSGDDGTGTGKIAYPEPDPSESDSYLTAAGKHIGAASQGAGRGLAGLADLGISGVNAASTFLSNPVRQLRGEEPQTAGFMHPLTDLYDKYAPAAPEGYETTAEYGEMFGPILAAEVVSGGLATPEALAAMRGASLMPKIAKIGTTAVAKPVLKTAVIGETGDIGGKVGGGVGEMVGGERGRTIGTLVGGGVGPSGGPVAAKSLANKALMDAESGEKLARLERQGISPTIGDVGTKGAALAQDVTGRGIVGGQPARQARADLFRKLEQAVIDNVATVRGRSKGVPEPSTGQISKESIGGELAHTSRTGIAKADKLIEDIQNELVRDIGGDTSVDPTPFYDRMDKVLSGVGDAGLRDQLYKIVDNFDKNVPASPTFTPPRLDPVTGKPPADPMDSVRTRQPTYEAVAGNRSEVGRTLTNEGQGIRKGFTSQAYEGMTEAMEETAKKQGVTDFGPRQAKTKQAYEDIEAMEPSAGLTGGAGAAFDSLFAGTDKQSIDRLDPFIRNAPEDTARVLANLLDFRLRGEGRAGIDQPDPTRFDMQRVEREIARGNPDYQIAMTGGIPEVEANLKDIGDIAHIENIRPGKRTAPGGVGSTIGALSGLGPGIGALGGLGLALTHGADLADIVSTAIYPAVGAVAGEASTWGLGKLLTSPTFTKAIADPTNPVGTALRRALEGANAAAAGQSSTDRTDQQRLWEEEQVRQFMSR